MLLCHKIFQEDQLNFRFPVFPGGIENSSRFPVFPRATDTLCYRSSKELLVASMIKHSVSFAAADNDDMELDMSADDVAGEDAHQRLIVITIDNYDD